MASTRSLGLHEPSALSYLVTEGILPPDPSEDLYKWSTSIDDGSTSSTGSAGSVDDELVWTKHCVVWSRAGMVKRVFRLDAEQEEIRHALFTQFAEGEVNRSAATQNANPFNTTTKTNAPGQGPGRRREYGSTSRNSGTILDLNAKTPVVVVDPRPNEKLSRALVVVLKSQAHIFFITGNSHTIPLQFEVDSVFATPRGILLQRKIPESKTEANPFVNYFLNPMPSQSGIPTSSKKRASLRLSSVGYGSSNPYPDSDLPRVFSLIDPHSEMGLVVTSEASHWIKNRANGNRRRQSGLDILDPSDEVIYISPKDELSSLHQVPGSPLILVITLNTATAFYTIWTARYRGDKPSGSIKEKTRRYTEGRLSTRRSSNLATGSTTPASRPGARESFGHLTDNRNASQVTESKLDDEEDLVARVAQDFGEVGVPRKSSRRVSSLLARTDLANSQDRITFSDLASGSQSSSIIHGGSRQSLGSTRVSFGFNPRASLPPAAGSVYSAAGSFEAPVDKVLESLNNDILSDRFENSASRDSATGLPEELLLSKVESFTARFTGSFQNSPSHRRLKISTLSSSDYGPASKGNTSTIAVCIVDQDSRDMTIVTLRAERVAVSKNRKSGSSKEGKLPERSLRPLRVHSVSIQNYPNVLDVARVTDGDISRIIALLVPENGRPLLSLHSFWGSPIKVDIPCPLQLYEPHGISSNKLVSRPRESGVNRVMADSELVHEGFDHASSKGKIDLVDTNKQRHRLQIRMEPRNDIVKKVLSVCKFVLRNTEKAGDGIQLAWWEVMKWLREKEEFESDIEWTAMVIVLFSLAVPFIKPPVQPPVKRTRRKKGLLRSSSGSLVDLESWEAMLDTESSSSGVVAPWMIGSAWSWIVEQDAIEEPVARRASRTPKNEQSMGSKSTYRPNSYLLRCISLTREFSQSQQGAKATGRAGYLPISDAFADTTRSTALGKILVGLHLFREEQKLSTCDAEESRRPLGLLAPVLAQIGGWLGWQSWKWSEDAYYGLEMASMDRWKFEDSRITRLSVHAEPYPPSSVFVHIIQAASGAVSPFITLLDVLNNTELTPRKGRIWRECFNITPRTFALNGFFSEVRAASTSLEKIQLFHRWGFTKSIIDTLPEGLSAKFYEVMMQAQFEASTSWNSSLLELIDREDLYISMNPANARSLAALPQPVVSHDAVRDYHYVSTSALEIDNVSAFEASAEADRALLTRLIFRDDKRFLEATRILNQTKAPVTECVPEPDWTETQLLDAQKELVHIVSFRTLSIPTGRAMLSFSSRLPLLTEKLPIPSFNMQCVMAPTNVTLSVDRAAFTEEKICWAFFHNGVSTGLAISKASKGIDTSWILFNKPPELTNRHAGFLLALGLNGLLRSLAKWVSFKYLTPKHTMTSIGLLLGLSASYLGTMDMLTTRLLSVHVTRMLPLGAAELNISPLTQAAGIMGIGLVYCGSQHRRMSEIMLSELENIDQDEQSTQFTLQESLRGEGYRLAAGFSLGLINLGKGKDLRGLRDMHIMERLLAIAVNTKNVDIAHVLDRATAGATIALAIVFMKTNDATLAKQIDIPDTTERYDYVRPDMFLLRTLARHLIMWDNIKPNTDWLNDSLPQIYRRRSRLRGVSKLRSEDMPFFNIIAGLCLALGLRFAGSSDLHARDLLLYYLVQLIRICRLPAENYDAKLARNSVRNCQDVVSLAASAVMAGTGDLVLFRRLRSLHGRIDPDTPYGSHMATNMAIGMLFLGGGSYTLGTSDLAVTSLLCAFYPIFPTSVLDNTCHLQAFRHLWVLAAEPRCLIPRDLDTSRPITIPITITSHNGSINQLSAPCLLPDPAGIAQIEVQGSDHWPLVLDFTQDNVLQDKFRHGDPSVYLRRKMTYSLPGASTQTSVFASTLIALSEAQDILPTSTAVATPARGLPPSTWLNREALSSFSPPAETTPFQSPWDWVFHLPSLKNLDIGERALVLPTSLPLPSPRICTHMVTAPPWLRTSSVDVKLSLSNTVHNIIQSARGRGADPDEVRDRIFQLKLLFEWLDRSRVEERADGGQSQTHTQVSGLWLRREFIEDLRWKIWGVQIKDEGVINAECSMNRTCSA
ncbi:hypothetical protein N7495_009783 [Penicillium taxi]|uniref:uncharacterized protein n=1 Tax=Penicillium taxi TaxID=168475 RepID=UPI0025459B55|nr:uncharacterized protein N7495_009783 [Penicillium taxi]KAJ5885273.1 hypothetical protein N7495_009783 [Penicillium taxi]